MAKERNYNPVQAQHKADKVKAIKKGKAEVQAQRNEKLARRNPDRIQTQIDDLKAVAAAGGKLSRHEEQTLEHLEKELRGVKKARDALGDKAPTLGRGGGGGGGGGGGALGKRRRDDGRDMDDSTDAEEIDEDVRAIPMPRDTPPPVPKAVLDRWWARRRARWAREREREGEREGGGGSGGAADRDGKKPQGGDGANGRAREKDGGDGPRSGMSTITRRPSAPPAPPIVSKTVYEAKPVMRDLRKEATAFVPAAVRARMQRGASGKRPGGPTAAEADRSEKGGSLEAREPSTATVEDAEDE